MTEEEDDLELKADTVAEDDGDLVPVSELDGGEEGDAEVEGVRVEVDDDVEVPESVGKADGLGVWEDVTEVVGVALLDADGAGCPDGVTVGLLEAELDVKGNLDGAAVTELVVDGDEDEDEDGVPDRVAVTETVPVLVNDAEDDDVPEGVWETVVEAEPEEDAEWEGVRVPVCVPLGDSVREGVAVADGDTVGV